MHFDRARHAQSWHHVGVDLWERPRDSLNVLMGLGGIEHPTSHMSGASGHPDCALAMAPRVTGFEWFCLARDQRTTLPLIT